MVARNDITGDAIQTKGVSDNYRSNYDLIFGKKKKNSEQLTTEEQPTTIQNQQTDQGAE